MRIAIARASSVGDASAPGAPLAWRPAMPVTQWIVGEAMIIAGIGCRKGTPAAEIENALYAALVRAGLDRAALGMLATSAAKETEPGIAGVAAALGVPLVIVAPADLEAAGERVATQSERVLALAGVPSVAEAAALAAGGPAARLIVPRIVVGAATCALVEGARHDGAFHRRRPGRGRSHHRARARPARALSGLPLCRLARAARSCWRIARPAPASSTPRR